MFKIICYGARENEVEFFNKLNKYNYELTLVPELLTHENIDTVKGHDAILTRGNCVCDAVNLEKIHNYGIKYVFTRTVGFNHIDLKSAAKYGIKVARVPSYSPNAIAELSLTLAMMLLRSTSYTTLKTSNRDFTVDEKMFCREVRNCTVGILGVGKIGLTEAKLFQGLGAKVIGYDIFQSEEAKATIEFKELDELLAESDIVSLHIPHFPGENDEMINAEFISKMKDNSILVNTARGEIVDNNAVYDALVSNKLSGFGTDVFANEKDIFFKKFGEGQEIPFPSVQKLVDMYPKVLVTPHVGSNTDEALSNMIETSYDNFNEILTKGSCVNEIS